jgi:hypothetical protein
VSQYRGEMVRDGSLMSEQAVRDIGRKPLLEYWSMLPFVIRAYRLLCDKGERPSCGVAYSPGCGVALCVLCTYHSSAHVTYKKPERDLRLSDFEIELMSRDQPG